MKIYQFIILCFLASAMFCCETDSEESLLQEITQEETPADTMVVTNPNPTDTMMMGSKITFNTHIKPIIDANCATVGCHVNPNPRRGISFETFSEVRQWEDRVRARIRLAIDPMPPASRRQLTNEEKDLIDQWSIDGLLEQ